MIERPGRHRDRDLRGLVGGVDLVGELRVPIAEAARRVGEPAEVSIGAPPQRFVGRRRAIFERLELGDLVEKIG